MRWLVKGADKIFAGTRIDRGLAADRGIDLREQAGRDLDEAAAALENSAGEADEIPDHAAAERNDVIGALDPEHDQPIGQRFELCPALGGLARGKDDRLDSNPGRAERHGQGIEMRGGDVRIGDHDEASARRIGRQPCAGATQAARFDRHLVAAIAERDGDDGHGCSALRIASTVASCGSGSERMWIGASA